MTRSQLRYVARGDAETEKFLTDRIGAKLAEIRKQARQTQKKNTGGIILEETDWEMEKMKKKKRKRKLPALYFPKHFGNEAIAYAFDVLIGFNRTPPGWCRVNHKPRMGETYIYIYIYIDNIYIGRYRYRYICHFCFMTVPS
tara:strand:- start:1310 stop:1735 length:426 start_codon:yes stop_codon:yes gene_type:complete